MGDVNNDSDINRNEYGELAGSRLTMEKTLKNIIHHTGVSIVDAFNMASKNPAKAIGLLDEIGTIEIGKTADLVIVDNDFVVNKVILKGEIVK
jgi:N-acetylglucosamine-6-phosphate deacetylase